MEYNLGDMVRVIRLPEYPWDDFYEDRLGMAGEVTGIDSRPGETWYHVRFADDTLTEEQMPRQFLPDELEPADDSA